MIKRWYTSPLLWVGLTLQVIAIVLTFQLYKISQAQLIDQIKADAKSELTFAADHIDETFSIIYDALSSISSLPGIRSISADQSILSHDTKATIQQVYNTLARHATVSELYIVPSAFNPERENEKPLVTFDEIIVGQNLDKGTEAHGSAEAANIDELEEVEIYEYREMAAQIQSFSREYLRQIPGEAPPLAISNEVITCDNSEFSRKLLKIKDDRNRTGFVLSLPFYDLSNRFAGIVSAVVRTNKIESLIKNRSIHLHLKARTKDYRLPREENPSSEKQLWELTQAFDLGALSGSYAFVSMTDQELKASTVYKQRIVNFWLTTGILEVILLLLLGGAFSFSQRERSRLYQATNIELSRLLKASEEAQKVKNSIVTNVSHEIRTPIHGILGLLELFQTKNLDSSQLEAIKLLKENSKNLMSIVKDLLTFSEIESGRVTIDSSPFDLAALIDEILDDFQPEASRNGNTLATSKLKLGFEVFGDRNRIRQIISQLVQNAIKFTKDGKIKIHVNILTQTTTDLEVDIHVKDTGPGISASDQSKIFRSFEQSDASNTRRHGGTGLGLYLSYSIAKEMGGNVRLESELGVGSTFTLNLKLKLGNPIQDSGSERGPAAIGALKILVVDDNKVNLLVLQKYLAKLGGSCDTAMNGADAVDKCKLCDYDLIFMDCQMPIMDGFEATRMIRKATGSKQFPVIVAVTANVSEYDKNICFEAGMNAYFSKPVTLDQISEFIDTLKVSPPRAAS